MSPLRSMVMLMVSMIALFAFMTPVMAQELEGITLVSSWFDTDSLYNRDMAWFRFAVQFKDPSYYSNPFLFSLEADVQALTRKESPTSWEREKLPGVMVSFQPDSGDALYTRETYGVMLPLTSHPKYQVSHTPTLRFSKSSDYLSIWGPSTRRATGIHHIVVAVPINTVMLSSVPSFPISWTASFGIEVKSQNGASMTLTSKLSDVIQAQNNLPPPQQPLSIDEPNASAATFYNITRKIEKPTLPEPTTNKFRRYSFGTFPLAVDLEYVTKPISDAPQYVSRIVQKIGYGVNLSGYGEKPSLTCGVYRILDTTQCLSFDDCAQTAWEIDDSFSFELNITDRELLDLTIKPKSDKYVWDGLPRRYICALPNRADYKLNFWDLRDGPQQGFVDTDSTFDYMPYYSSSFSTREAFPSLIRSSIYVTTLGSNGEAAKVEEVIIDDNLSANGEEQVVQQEVDITNPFLAISPNVAEDLSVTDSRPSRGFATFCLSCETRLPDLGKFLWWVIVIIVAVCLIIPLAIIILCCGCCGCLVCLAQQGPSRGLGPSASPVATVTITNSGYQPQGQYQQYPPQQGGYQQYPSQQGGYYPPNNHPNQQPTGYQGNNGYGTYQQQ